MQWKRNMEVLNHIIRYCDEIEHTMSRFGKEYCIFAEDSVYQNAVALCVLQIGELVTRFTDDFKTTYNEVPWKQMNALRDVVVQNDGKIDKEVLWETITVDIPVLKSYCGNIADENEN